ncbi:CAP domain-containing protein [Methanolobus sp. ZRKC3]|uniref:CAP domain-containing protein n=1 Tax=Methanolobus sp. ZRKC3 TaxID=3125786 RepID=UPI003250C36B
MLDLINDARSQNGLDPLRFNPLLNEVASEHSKEMIEMDYFSHDSYDGTGFAQRILDSGYVMTYAGENIAMRYPPSVQIAHDGLMNSPGHRANILNPNYNEIGIGIWVGGYLSYPNTAMYTQDFGWSNSVTPVLVLEDSYPSGELVSSSSSSQIFSVGMNLPSDVSWYLDGAMVRVENDVVSSSYEPNVQSTGTHSVEVSVTDSQESVSRSWTWTVESEESVKGDFDGDGAVGIIDFSAFAKVYNTEATMESAWADFNDDGSVNIIDFSAFAKVYNK